MFREVFRRLTEGEGKFFNEHAQEIRQLQIRLQDLQSQLSVNKECVGNYILLKKKFKEVWIDKTGAFRACGYVLGTYCGEGDPKNGSNYVDTIEVVRSKGGDIKTEGGMKSEKVVQALLERWERMKKSEK